MTRIAGCRTTGAVSTLAAIEILLAARLTARVAVDLAVAVGAALRAASEIAATSGGVRGLALPAVCRFSRTRIRRLARALEALRLAALRL